MPGYEGVSECVSAGVRGWHCAITDYFEGINARKVSRRRKPQIVLVIMVIVINSCAVV